MTASFDSKWKLRAGYALSILPIGMMLMSGVMKLTRQPELIEQFVGKFGYAEGALLAIGLLEIACVILYAIPRTAMLGAVLLTGYLGGAVATHVRIGDAFIIPVAIGVLIWAGLFLREPRLRVLLPLRSVA